MKQRKTPPKETDYSILRKFHNYFQSTKTKLENYADVHMPILKKMGKHAYFIHANESEVTIPHLC